MHQRDVAALNKSLAAYKKLSPRARAEISELQLRCGKQQRFVTFALL